MSQLQPASDSGGAAVPPVSTELEEIFVAATGLPSSHAVWRPLSQTPRGRSRNAGRRLPVEAFGAAAAMILAGASAFAIAYSAPSGPEAPAPASPTHHMVSIVTAAAAPAAPVSPIVGSERVGLVSGVPPFQPKAGKIRSRSHLASSRRPGHGDLFLADRQLRRAYARAVSAGVPRTILVDYRNRWADLRDEASWRPDRVAVGYRAMAGDLTRMSQPPRRYSPRGSSREARAW